MIQYKLEVLAVQAALTNQAYHISILNRIDTYALCSQSEVSLQYYIANTPDALYV